MVKWNKRLQKYETYNLPDNWNCPLSGKSQDKINCSNCGKEILYHNSYTSHEIINENTRKGYPICELCRIKEIYNCQKGRW